jgi:hypothetical protein
MNLVLHEWNGELEILEVNLLISELTDRSPG